MKIKFVKQHVAGIPKGSIKDVDSAHGKRLIDEGYAVEAKEGDKEEIVPFVEEKCKEPQVKK